MATERITLTPVDAVDILTLIDNSSDMLLAGDDRVKRPGWTAGVRVEAPMMLDATLPRFLAAEHGFSALVTVTHNGAQRRIMFDAGLSVDGLAHNLDVLELALDAVEALVFSHGHFDHVGGLHGLIKRFGARRLPLLLHPDFWLQRRVVVPNAEPFDLPSPSRAGVEGHGFEIVEGASPSLLLDGCVLITGEVARTTGFEKGFPVHQALRDGAWTPDPLILDDQALIVNVRDRGLVILTGCGHAGAVNIVRHAQALTGEMRVHALIGGLHLSGRAFEASIPPTVAALREIAPSLIVPGHCTGFAAVRALSDALPDAVVLNSVGTRYVL
jgi:7,8-dihydropterin-6-yl-methyl-4-(beta-D-ribofuranosyl)aminobenzene 5'-phosphate synthase